MARRVKLIIETSEIIVDRSGTEHTDASAFLLIIFEHDRLDDHTQTFHKEYATRMGNSSSL